MPYFEQISANDHEEVVFCSDKDTGLKAFIAIHDTSLGPALGGCRMRAYTSEADAFGDALKLSRAMTFKNSLAGLDFGGGKTVAILDHPSQKTPEWLDALARRIHTLKGSYYGAGDVGSTTSDLARMKQTTPYFGGLAEEDGGLGDSSIMTAYGVYMGLKATVKIAMGVEDLAGLSVAVQGTGKVGYHLIEHLVAAGSKIYATDVSEASLKKLHEDFPQVTIVSGEELYQQDVDIFSPNAVGGTVDQSNAKTLKAKVIVGGANNILADAETGQILQDRGILFAPDFLVNAGGVIVISCEIKGHTLEDARKQTEAIYGRTLDVFNLATSENLLPYDAARKLALRRIQDAASHSVAGK